ncbi:FMN-dependent dehydrogenase-domain-containing protein, partial [Mycena olivaceomarginata]
FTVFLDSDVRTGTDVLKAVALGADAVFLGRAYLWASCVGGKDGVKQLIHQTMAEINVTLGLLGYTSLDELRGCNRCSECLNKGIQRKKNGPNRPS